MNPEIASRTTRTILYAEDEEDDIFFMQRAFSAAGITYPLITVPDGQEAIDYLQGGGRYANRDEFPVPYLLLLDLNLPRKSGLDVLKWIRNEPAVSTLPVIVLSSLPSRHGYPSCLYARRERLPRQAFRA